MKVLGDGRTVCSKCLNTGVLPQRLGCGHIGLPGMTVAQAGTPGMSRCPQCSGELTLTERVLGRTG